ncbi:hypothetical protein [Streptomyces sp. NBC_00878]|uniref:hypothetical protein n=1 Tax=Streptomyces sp. NBC_00878 TaxID=2975854 RepID=UPI002253C18F|nr:hypothetical protein [Streptomyces sp. NBC_00878]MCX4904437.1 hypothetical protein [Streptomyces sp. NBC_00878]
MSRSEETDEPTAEDPTSEPGKSVDLGKREPAGETSEPPPRFAVVISGDGSAAIDGEPVPTTEGVPLDAAILDTLHGHARDRNTTVTATISDPSAGYVAFVEVAPDGSSSLLEQQEQPPEQDEHAIPPIPPEPSEAGLDDDDEAAAAADDEAAAAADDEAAAAADDEAAAAAAADDEAAAAADADVDAAADADVDAAADADVDADAADEAAADEDDGSDDEAYEGEQQRRWLPAGLPSLPSLPSIPRPSLSLSSTPTSGPTPSPGPSPTLTPKIVRKTGSRQSDDEYVSRGLLHKPLVVGPVALGVAALIVVPLVIVGGGESNDGGRQSQAGNASSKTSRSPQAEEPTPTESANALPPRPSTTATSPSPKPKKTPKKTKSGGQGTVTVTAKPPRATVTAKPPQDTAATAVTRLARNDPSGRHICYRAYVSGQGWQKPVCDGTMAGTTGQKRPIKALNIAVSGTGGSAANAFVHNPDSANGEGKWKPQWTAIVADGKNNYIGSAKSSAPNMLGFAINIGSGQVCQIVKVAGSDWGGRDCADPRPDLVFGGALENTRYLEAVMFTV